MEYPKTINLLRNTLNHPSKFKTKNWFEIIDDARRTYNADSQTEFKTSMLKSSLCDYNNAYILVTVAPQTGDSINNKGVVFKNCALLTDCISEINNTEIDNAKYINVVMPMYNLI